MLSRLPLLLPIALSAPAALALALDTTSWKFTQPVSASPGTLASLELPDATLDAARADLADLRLVDAAGTPVPHVADRPAARASSERRRLVAPKTFGVALGYNATVITLETGLSVPVNGVDLHTPAAGFLKPARVEGSSDGRTWSLLADSLPVFRTKSGAENLRLEFPAGTYSHLRVTVDDAKDDPIPFSGVAVREVTETQATDPRVPVPVTILHREEKPGVTRLRLDLGAAHLPLSGITFDTPEPLFTRRVTVAVEEERDGVRTERVIARGPVWNITGLGGDPSSRRRMELESQIPGREVLVTLDNGDSPPLAITGVSADRRPHRLLFVAPPGQIFLLSGNPRAAAPEYDLGPLDSKIRAGVAVPAKAAALAENPRYRETEGPRPTFIAGAKIDTAPWKAKKRVILAKPGVQTLEIDPETLCHARADLGDLRLVAGGVQLPYLLQGTGRETPVAARATELPPTGRGEIARFRLELPPGDPPLLAVDFQSAARNFRRPVRLVREEQSARDGVRAEVLATMDWRSLDTPETTGNRLRMPVRAGALAPTQKGASVSLVVEIDNGANSPVIPSDFRILFPVTNLRFIAPDAGEVTLHFANPAAQPPDYADLRLVAAQLAEARASRATLGPLSGASGDSALSRLSGPALWCALAALVGGLLFAVSKILPKSDDAP